MQIRIHELKLRADHSERELLQEIQKILKWKGCVQLLDPDRQTDQKDAAVCEIVRQSIDARKKPEIFYVYTVDVSVEEPKSVVKKIKSRKVSLTDKKEYRFPYQDGSFDENDSDRPIIVGSGPAGLFCALMLARCGLRPIILERGEAVERRLETVRHFWETGELNEQSNVQFGEGGAGTFSDGKLNTLIKDPDGKIRFTMQQFVNAGADPKILYHHKPHVGTDVLVSVVKNIREEIISLGGEVRFSSCVTKLERAGERAYRVQINDGETVLSAQTIVLAIGHSARDTFSMLYDAGLEMQPKSFAVGLRMEHPQNMINAAMYGEDCPYEMEAAPYKAVHKCQNKKGVYSFCMCPGGYVVNASSEQGRLAVNGMSYKSRDGENANSAIVVTVSPEDYGGDHPLSGVEFQRRLEENAFGCGNAAVPVQRFEDFCQNRATQQFGIVRPQIKGQFKPANVRSILPEYLNEALIEGIVGFGKKIKGFDHPDALLSGVESRTSSPVRILRDEDCQARFSGIYPCGEGAGYAGGITSAAVDGIRVAEAVCRARRCE